MIAQDVVGRYTSPGAITQLPGAHIGNSIRVSEVRTAPSVARAHSTRRNPALPLRPMEGSADDTGNSEDRALRVGGECPPTEERFKIVQDAGGTLRHRTSIHRVRDGDARVGFPTYREPHRVHSLGCSLTVNCVKISGSRESAVQPKRSGWRINVATDDSRKTNV